jgi:hypothetical protein
MGNNISSILRSVSTPVANLHPKAWAGKYFRLGYSPALFNKKLTRGNYLTLRFLPAMI